ncbi:CoA transferase [Bosea sp. (in: a-proteobacteria)]|uniref:CoA transferase n=1 Tax=Bosea sp. (in: a-proteobacteria) TaxID=1871050 RepID=UPI00262AF65E|nr:CoA transferase [Bosea sp. (in: a-proteobacteria)]MCO5091220.1 CoA transferase [Bosea sp. (in: a-proteobacteria)]
MYQLLGGMRVVEGSSFIAAPSCGLYLAQLGAEVIRFDMIGGGPDFNRWPQAPGGASLYWEGLNKGKKSIAIDLSSPEGRELAVALIAAPGEERGIFLTNFPAAGFLSHERLSKSRPDLITLRVMGHADGTPAVDYTINSAVGIPQMTGPATLGEEPVNHVLPAWDLVTGAYAAFALLAAERCRRGTGRGQEVRIPLSDVAAASLGHLGQIAETSISGADRARYGNNLFGAFGKDFLTRDGRRLMIVAITTRQWTGLVAALGIAAQIKALEAQAGLSFDRDEGTRFRFREPLNAIVAGAVAARDHDALARAFDANGVCWGPYRTLHQALAEDAAFSTANPVFAMVDHPSGHSYLTPGAAATFGGGERSPPVRAPRLGEHTDAILAEVLGLSSGQIAALHDRKVVAGAEATA